MRRFAKFNLELHPDKTRLIEFGRFAAPNRRKRGVGKPETFEFLGFTHICGKTSNGRFWLRRITDQKEAEGEAEAVEGRASAAPALAHPRAGMLAGERSEGHLNYYAVPGNVKAVRPSGNRPAALVQVASASQPENPAHLGTDGPPGQALDTQGRD